MHSQISYTKKIESITWEKTEKNSRFSRKLLQNTLIIISRLFMIEAKLLFVQNIEICLKEKACYIKSLGRLFSIK